MFGPQTKYVIVYEDKYSDDTFAEGFSEKELKTCEARIAQLIEDGDVERDKIFVFDCAMLLADYEVTVKLKTRKKNKKGGGK